VAFVVQIAVSFDLNPGFLLHKPAVLRKSFPGEIANKEKKSVAVVVEIVVSVDLGFLPFVQLEYKSIWNLQTIQS
jgi:hypothetical protein